MADNKIQQVKQRFSIIGDSPAFISAIERALRVAPIDLSVLIIGESGAGKEVFPKIIHENSARKHNKYIAVNCGAIPEGTIDSELFGHEKGAFTGAVSARKGYFEEAHGGTIFLDEVAELPLTTQARLLRVLESGEYIKVGSSEVKKTDIRVVAATNKNMEEEIKNGKFREDLFYRLSTVQINVPPLHERQGDIWLLTRKFTNDFADRYRTAPVTYDETARNRITSYRWPGNVRQLKNIVEQIALFEAGKTITADVVSHYLPEGSFTPVVADRPQFDYTLEREMLFKLISQLHTELQQVKEMIGTDNFRTDKPKRDSHISTGVVEIKRTPSSIFADNDVPTHEQTVNKPFAHEVTAMPVDEVTTVRTLEDTERETIIRALERNGGKRKKTADELNISERTLYRKIKSYGI